MQRYNARDIYNLPKDKIWLIPDENHILVFEDGEVVSTKEKTVFGWYCAVFHRLFPKAPLLLEHHLGNSIMGKDSTNQLLSNGLNVVRDTYKDFNKETLMLISMQANNEIYNDFTKDLKPYVGTISILDFLDVMDDPVIKEANASVQPTQLSMDQTYHIITERLKAPGVLKGNAIAKMAKLGLVSMGQILQCVGPRGFITDIDSHLFRKPILKGYVEGIDKLEDSMKESRSASKALAFQKDPVSLTEYFNREMQLMASIVTRIHKGDCGSNEYIPFKVKSSDLKKIDGKFYKSDTGELKEVRKNDRFLIGKIIELRSSLKCHHPDPYGVCETCMGKIAGQIPDHTNLGHTSASVLGEKVTQNVLATKHLDGSSKVDEMELDTFEKRFIRSDIEKIDDGTENEGVTVIKLAERLKGCDVEIIMVPSQAFNLSDIDYHDIDTLSPENISKLNEVLFKIKDAKGNMEIETIPVSMGSRLSFLTRDVLIFIKENGFKLNEKGNYCISLKNWDNNKPLLQLPMKHTDMIQYMKTIKSFVKHTGKRYLDPKTREYGTRTVEKTLADFYNLISSKLHVNIAHLEVIILSCMVRDTEDYRLPRPISKGQLSNYTTNMERRSLGTSMGYQGHAKILRDVASFKETPRPDSLFDNLLVPYPTHNPSS